MNKHSLFIHPLVSELLVYFQFFAIIYNAPVKSSNFALGHRYERFS